MLLKYVAVCAGEGGGGIANTYVLGIIDGTCVGMCEDTGTICGYCITVSLM